MYDCSLIKSPPDVRDFIYDTPKINPFKKSKSSTFRLPSSLDLRPQMPPVVDQSNIGLGVTSAASNLVRALLKNRNVELSRLYIEWNAKTNVSENLELCVRDVCKAIKLYGVCHESLWPYDSKLVLDPPPLVTYKNALMNVNLHYARVGLDLFAIKCALVEGRPLMLGVEIYESFIIGGEIPVPNVEREKHVGGQALLVVGYNDETERFIAMNSWGKEWGNEGYCFIPYSYVLDPNLTMELWRFSLA